jgi:hypothetical protein
MQRLPRGITGFDATDHRVSVLSFTTACHAAARQLRGRVQHVRDAAGQVTPNFHEALVSWNDGAEAVRVLCNAHHPMIAFASPTNCEGDTRLDFVDCPEVAGPLRAEFHILSLETVCAGTSPEALVQLGDAELDQMRYWKPQRIGDLIFNFWD